jgi:hypothetical protein
MRPPTSVAIDPVRVLPNGRLQRRQSLPTAHGSLMVGAMLNLPEANASELLSSSLCFDESSRPDYAHTASRIFVKMKAIDLTAMQVRPFA